MINHNFPIKPVFFEKTGFCIFLSFCQYYDRFADEQSAIASGSSIQSDVRSLAKF
ncbi:hypothetical protein NDI49_11200 [Trichocoleus sp. ST-U3]|uniref:hypothetical protein n=1 Tax=Coleofasciculus sp. FACHB-542 TaxID=2692787 RepID=UPI001686B2FA|nr:hypothetical protein [Coleofasciculus sp. FACHB-542]MBD2084997.1 hypothetical protein [Coleofasciculus sp. FACHB-542]